MTLTYSDLPPFVRDTIERASSTAVQTFTATMLASPIVSAVAESDYDAVRSLVVAAAIAGGSSALAVVKAAIARKVGDPESASLDRSNVGAL